MSQAQYDRLSTDDPAPGSRGLSPRRSPDPVEGYTYPPPAYERGSLESDDSGSDLVYRDIAEEDPFEADAEKQFRHSSGSRDDEDVGYSVEPRRPQQRKSRKILVVLIFIVGAAAMVGLLAATSYSGPNYEVKQRHITMDHVMNGTFSPHYQSTSWVKEAEDGTFSSFHNGAIVLATVQNPNQTRELVRTEDVLDPRSQQPLAWDWWRLSPDGEYILFRTEYRKQWRHSSHGVFWVHRLKDHRTMSVHKGEPASFAVWSPVGHSLAYVSKNDVYVVPGMQLSGNDLDPIRVTNDGSDVVFNGAPDWVYEEEVFATDTALWWSPKGDNIAFLRSNESEVPVYELQYYNPTNNAFNVNPYPTKLDMRYPKPGTPNPDVSVHTFNLKNSETKRLKWKGELAPAAHIITEVAWVSDDGLIVKEIDRAARVGVVVLFTAGRSSGKIVRKLGEGGEGDDNGWIDHGQDVIPMQDGYLDVIPKDGYNHLAFFTPVNSSEPVWLTEGEWEVDKISGVDKKNGIVYFLAAKPSIDRHVYSVALPKDAADFTPELKPLTDTSAAGYHEVDFSPEAGFYSLKYLGPLVPWQRLMQTGEGGLDRLLEDNNALNHTLQEFQKPVEIRSTIVSDGFEFNVMEILPPNLDTSGRKKYPVLIQVYGGPYSQTVDNKFKRDWHSYLACEQKYVIVRIDGRGTGFRGRKVRNPIRDDIGHWEVVDQIELARQAIKRKYIDRSRVGIWGWSYGGYMTLKTLEAGYDLFTLGMAVAPVTDWRYYDSIYTERYMNTLEANVAGYDRSSVHNVSAFAGKDLLLAHGTGDDNVHFLNMASLVDKLTQEKVRGWRMRVFTDSSHSIATRGANRELYEWMTAYLQEKWGKGGNH